MWRRMTPMGTLTQALSATSRQHTKEIGAPGLSARAKLVKAAGGSSKNITPNVENARSKGVSKVWLAAS